jgi:hypothetical protein
MPSTKVLKYSIRWIAPGGEALDRDARICRIRPVSYRRVGLHRRSADHFAYRDCAAHVVDKSAGSDAPAAARSHNRSAAAYHRQAVHGVVAVRGLIIGITRDLAN